MSPIAIFLLGSSVLLHPVHATVSELEWNAKSNRVEVALRLDALDEQWIARRRDERVDGDWQAAFLRSTLFFFAPGSDNAKTGSKPQAMPIDWLGRKEQGAHVWWFFEVVCDSGQPPAAVETKLLFDRHENYQHRFVILDRRDAETGKRPVVLLTSDKPKAALQLGLNQASLD